MSDRRPVEESLRRALRAEDPGPELLSAVMRSVAARTRARTPLSTAATRAVRIPSMRVAAALAATFIAAIAIARWDRYLHEGEQAREQAMQALRLASHNLNVVHRVVRDSEGN